MFNPGVRYVEEYYIKPDLQLPLEHTWNEWRGVQFDVTVEIRGRPLILVVTFTERPRIASTIIN